MALAFLEVHSIEIALDQSDLLAPRFVWLDLTDRNQSNHRNLPPGAVADLVVVMDIGFAEAGKPLFVGYVVDL